MPAGTLTTALGTAPTCIRTRMNTTRRSFGGRPPRAPPYLPRRQCWPRSEAVSSVAAGDGGDGATRSRPPRWQSAVAHLAPLSDPEANTKLLALSTAQCLSSISTLMHDTYLPLYMAEVLGMSNTKMGNLHALLQFLSRASGVISGRLADIFSPAKMVIVGMLLTAALCKPMFALCGPVRTTLGVAACVSWVTFAKIFDRTAKGVREAPSKALVGDLAAQSGDSAAPAFSVRQALSTLGMLLGSVAAGKAFQLSGRNYETTFALSMAPAALGLLLVLAALGRGGPAHAGRGLGTAAGPEGDTAQLGLAGKAAALLGTLQPAYWQALAAVALLFGARFDVAFIAVHASTVMDKASLPTLTAFSMVPVVVLATPMGSIAKRTVRARNTMLMLGTLVLVAGNLCFAFIPSALGMILGSTCVGIHMSMTQGVLYGMLASYIPSHAVPGLGKISGIAWSLTDLLLGVALAASNTLAGRLCDLTVRRGMGSTGCFLGACGACTLFILAMLLFSTFGGLGREDLLPEAARPKAA